MSEQTWGFARVPWPHALFLLVALFASQGFAQPFITSQPTSTSAVVGSTVGFSVAATGTGTLNYQWRRNGTNMVNGAVSGAATVSGATTAALTLTGITTNNATIYSCRITNTTGSVTSSVAVLTVIVPPSFSAQPKSTNVVTGGNASFSCLGGGTGPLSYQWYKDGSPISGATLNSYSISGVFVSDSGAYAVRVSNSAGSATSTNAVLNVGIPISITAQPVSLVVTQGLSASFSVTASGTAPAYYWRKNGVFIPGQTNTTLTFASTVPTNAATYSCIASNFFGAVASANATLTVNYPPTITVQPVSRVVGVGSNFTVNVTANGVPALAYQWRYNETNIGGATGSSYTVINTQPANAGGYDVVLTNTLGSVTSSVATITVVYLPPALSQQPVGGNFAVGNPFALTATASGTAPLSWQWFKDDVALTNAAAITTNLTGNTTFNYTNDSAQLADAGSYWVVVNNSTGSVTSSVAVVNVGYAPVIVQQPLSATNNLGGSNTFSCTVTGSAPINLQWTFYGNPIAAATNAVLTLTNLQPAKIGYYAMTATNLFGVTASSNAALHLVGYDSGIWSGLVAYYPFNGNANDASGYGGMVQFWNSAYLTNSSGRMVAHIQSSSAYNDSTGGHISLSAPSITDFSNYSASFWIREIQNLGGGESFLTAGEAAGSGFLFLHENNAGNVLVTTTNGTLQAYPVIKQFNGNEMFGVWHHYLLAHSPSNTAYYLDGTNFANVSGMAAPDFTGRWFLGRHWWSAGTSTSTRLTADYMNIRIYNRALSSNEVASLYAVEADLPVITQQPLAQTLNAGGTATFTVNATANYSLTYQWRKSSTPIAGATNLVLTLTNVQAADVAFYSVTVSNAVSGIASASALLNINGYADPTWKGLVAYYQFNGNANDQSGNGRNGTNNGAVLSADRFGNSATAYRFDGSQNLTFGSVPLSQVDNWSLCAWISPSSLNQQGFAVTMGTDDTATADGFAFGVASGANQAGKKLVGVLGGVVWFDSGSAFSISNRWHQVVMLRAGGVTKFYLDGIQTANTTTAVPRMPTAFYIGSATGIRYFQGQIDDVRIYNRALSADEVDYLYQLESQATPVAPLSLAASLGAGPSLNLIGSGLPVHSYILQSATNLAPPVLWEAVITNTTDTNGMWQLTDTNLTSPQKFYRVTAP